MTEKGILVLNTIGFFLETALGIWIFSQAFPRRKEMVWEWRLILNEALLHGLLLFIIFLNFFRQLTVPVKFLLSLLWIGTLLFYRNVVIKKGILKKQQRDIVEKIVLCVEFFIIGGIIAWNYRSSYISVLAVLAGNIFLPFFYCKYYECKWFQAYIFEVIYVGFVQILKCGYMFYVGENTARSLLEMNPFGGMQTISGVFFSLILYAGVFLLTRVVEIGKVLRRALEEYKWRSFFLAVAEVTLLNFATNLGTDKIKYQDVRIVITSVAVVVIVTCLLLVLLLKKTLETEQQLLSVRNQAIERQYAELRSAYEENRCLIHDERYRMQYLMECMENNEYEKARTFLREYQTELEMQRRKHWSPITALDFILNMKIQKIEELGIRFPVKTNLDSIKINESDFVVLLGNLLDNAIEATAKCSRENREIMLNLQEVNDLFLITVENTAIANPEQKNGRFMTSKKNKKEHGWGIQSMQHIVAKYGGDIEFKYKSERFRVEITFWKGDLKDEMGD